MSLSVYINDSKFNLSTQINLFGASINPAANTYNHQVLVELTYNLASDYGNTSISKTVSFVQKTDGNGYCQFNLSDIYQTIVTPMIMGAKKSDLASYGVPFGRESIHNLPLKSAQLNYLFSWSILEGIPATAEVDNQEFRGNANVLDFKFYEMNSTTADGIPQKDASTEITKKVFMFWGRANESDPIEINFEEYKMDGITKKFLSSNYNYVDGVPNVNISKDEYHTISFLNRCQINQGAETGYLQAIYYDENGSVLGNLSMKQSHQTGGVYQADATDVAANREGFYLHCGVGLKNLEKLTLNTFYFGTLPSNVTGGIDAIKSYTITMRNASNTAPMSLSYKFNIVDYCNRYEQSRIAYMNRFGAWEYMTFNKEKENDLDVKREYINKPLLSNIRGLQYLGDVFLDSSYPPNVAKQGKMTTSVSANESFTLFTDNLKDYEIDMVKDLMMSPQIHILEGEEAKALILETSNMKLKGDKNTGLYKYELRFKYASPKYRTTR